ncbi:hypothetical protein [Deinococcus malanensis]|uniref:hypothetical protein n=1 Tax=Deinococcus malanensis TaxID=1706855 RepID=UPI001667D9A2|nr:hypothetical protein [Deinococcus malanensis]
MSAMLLPAGALPTAQESATWSTSAMAGAQYIILPPRIEGKPKGLTEQQRTIVLNSMRHDLAGSLKRRYPKATVGTTPAGQDVITVTPVIQAPKVLLPWGKLDLKLIFERKNGQQLLLKQQFTLLSLWQQQDDAAKYAYDKLINSLP